MPNREWWTGWPGSGRRDAALALARDAAARGDAVWWVVEHRRQEDALEAALLPDDQPAVLGVSALLAGRLPELVLRLAGREVQPVPPDVRTLTLRALLQRGSDDSLPEIGPGWAAWASRLVERLHAGDPRDDGLRSRIRARYPWLADAIDAYHDRLARTGRIDEAAVADEALGVLNGSQVPLPPALLPDLLIVDRIAPPPRSLDRLLRRVIAVVPRAVVLLDGDPERRPGDAARIAPALVPAETRLDRWRSDPPETVRPFPLPPERANIRRALFTGHRPDPDRTRTATVLHHLHPRTEVEAVLRDLALAQRVDGLADSDLAIVPVARAPYVALLRELGPVYGVRLDLQDAVPLWERPLGALVRTLFSLRAGGMDRETVISLLLDPLVRFGDHLRRRQAVLELDDAAREAGVDGRRGNVATRWREPLDAVATALRRHAGERRRHPDEDPEASSRAADRLDRHADGIAASLKDLQRLEAIIQALPDAASATEVRRWLTDVFQHLGVQGAVHRDPPPGGFDERLSLARLEALLGHLDQAGQLRGTRRWPVAEWRTQIEEGLRRTVVPQPRRVRGGVPVLGPGELRGRRVKRLHVLGLIDSQWPPRDEHDPLLPLAEGRNEALHESREQTLEALVAGAQVALHVPVPRDGDHADAPSPLVEQLLDEGHARRADGADDAATVTGGAQTAAPVVSHVDLLAGLGRDLAGGDAAAAEAARKRFATALALRPDRLAGEAVLHTLWVEVLRQDPTGLSRYEGQLANTEVGRILGQRLADGPLSATRLDRYAQCPMKAFFADILGVEPFDAEPEDEADGGRVGQLIHDTLAAAVEELRDRRGGGDVNLNDDPDDVEAVIAEALDREAERLGFTSPLDHALRARLRAGLGDDDASPGRLKRMLLKSWSKATKSNPLPGDLIARVEAAFGLPPDPDRPAARLREEPLELADPSGGPPARLRGRIDRIGWSEDGWRVWDYKTGSSVPSTSHLEEGLTFQLPVYLWALQQAMVDGALPRRDIALAAYIHLKKDACSVSGIVRGEAFADADPVLRQRLADLRRSMRAGRFHHPLSQDDRLCKRGDDHHPCVFANYCRRDNLLFAQRERVLEPDALTHAYTFPFQDHHQEGDA